MQECRGESGQEKHSSSQAKPKGRMAGGEATKETVLSLMLSECTKSHVLWPSAFSCSEDVYQHRTWTVSGAD